MVSRVSNYSDENIRTLEGLEHVRMRPGMYIGGLGNGSSADDGIYVLFKEVVDNSVDEFRMHMGNTIEITLEGNTVRVRDYGRGIPQGKMVDAVSKLNTGAKYDTKTFQSSVGLNGVGLKAVNALSSRFVAMSFRDGLVKRADFECGKLVKEYDLEPTKEKNGTFIEFTPDNDKDLFGNYKFNQDYIENMLRNYSYLNTGLTLVFNGQKYLSKNGLLDLLNERNTEEPLYDVVHIKGDDIEIAFTHTNQNGEEYFSFVNGQNTTQGGTHQSALKEHLARTIKDFYNKGFELSDVRNGIVAAIAVNVINPVFDSQKKDRFTSSNMAPDKDEEGTPYPRSGVTVNKFVGDFIKKEVDNLLYKDPALANTMLVKIQESEKERKAIASVTKVAREKAKKAKVNNIKLRDCRVHFNDAKGDLREETCIFITEGDSASGSITQARDANVQAVFSLKGKPHNCFGESKEVVYKNEELFYLQDALNIEEGLEGLRYNKVIIATDADEDGMHIRMLLLTYFLQFFPDLVKKGHLYIMQTPLFRVRNKKEQRYCYSEEERIKALQEVSNPEITRFKGLGEISPPEFKGFLGTDLRLDPVTLRKEDAVYDMLAFYMGKNTPERQNFIIDNLRVEEDL